MQFYIDCDFEKPSVTDWSNRRRKRKNGCGGINNSDVLKAETMALADLDQAGIKPESAAGQEYLFRARAFGIMGVQPPITELNK